jgi:outer membrane protein TolC
MGANDGNRWFRRLFSTAGRNAARAKWLACIAIVVTATQAQTVPGADSGEAIFTDMLNGLVAEVRADNPRIKAAGNRVDAAGASVNYRKSLDPPIVAVESYQTPIASFPDPLKNYQEIDYSIEQMFPFPGKLAAQATVESGRRAMLGQDKLALEQSLVHDVKSAFFELYLIDRRLEIIADNREIMKGFVEIARKRYEVGTGGQADILRGQTELSTLESDAIVLEQDRKSAAAMINALCNAEGSRALPFIPAIHPTPVNFSLDTLASLAEANRPEFASMRYAVSMRKSDLIAARRDFLPDIMVRGTYKQMRPLPDDWALMVGVSVPIAPWSYGKYSAATQRAALNERESQSEYENMKNMVLSQVQDALAEVASARERIRLYSTTVIPQARQTLQSTADAYRSGTIDFLSLIDAHHLVRFSEQDYHMAVMNLLTGEADLEKAVGVSMEEMTRLRVAGLEVQEQKR